MSTQVEEQTGEERAERPVLVRAFTFEAALGTKRTLDVRVVPFDEIGEVADPPDFRRYREQWMPGVFAKQERAANRIMLRFRHDTLDDDGYRKPGLGLTGIVGHGLSLREATDGYHGSFKLHDSSEADTARTLIEDGVIPGVSAEFVPLRSIRSREGIVQRVKAHLDSVSLAFTPVYSKAAILALREQEEIVDEEMLPPLPSKTLLERAQRLGIEIPDGMAHLLARAFTEVAWDGSPARWASAAAYCSACAIDTNRAGTPKSKQLCHLPYKEPGGGDVNINAVRNALGQLEKITAPDVTQADKDKARALLERLLAQFNGGNANTPTAARETPANEQEPLRHLAAMLAAAERYMATEPDAVDMAAMRQIIQTLRRLSGKDTSSQG